MLSSVPPQLSQSLNLDRATSDELARLLERITREAVPPAGEGGAAGAASGAAGDAPARTASAASAAAWAACAAFIATRRARLPTVAGSAAPRGAGVKLASLLHASSGDGRGDGVALDEFVSHLSATIAALELEDELGEFLRLLKQR